MTTPIITARQFADQFKTTIREWLTAEQLVEVDRRNGLRCDATCATHDFCDANMAMLAAVQTLTNLSEDEACDRLVNPANYDTLFDAVNDGWTLAKVEGFHQQA